MEVKQLIVGAYAVNCYILSENDHCIIIDPGKNAKKIMSAIGDLTVDAICLTHGHFDHIGAVDDLVNEYHCPVYIHRDDVKLIRDCPYNQMNGYKAHIYHNVMCYGDSLDIGDFHFKIIETPGHTDGSVLLISGNKMFAGDVLFEGSIGRCDLYSGSDSKMNQSLKLIKSFKDDYIVYPGHGNITTLSKELMQNPFLI